VPLANSPQSLDKMGLQNGCLYFVDDALAQGWTYSVMDVAFSISIPHPSLANARDYAAFSFLAFKRYSHELLLRSLVLFNMINRKMNTKK
jgi:hypothetical protein